MDDIDEEYKKLLDGRIKVEYISKQSMAKIVGGYLLKHTSTKKKSIEKGGSFRIIENKNDLRPLKVEYARDELGIPKVTMFGKNAIRDLQALEIESIAPYDYDDDKRNS